MDIYLWSAKIALFFQSIKAISAADWHSHCFLIRSIVSRDDCSEKMSWMALRLICCACKLIVAHDSFVSLRNVNRFNESRLETWASYWRVFILTGLRLNRRLDKQLVYVILASTRAILLFFPFLLLSKINEKLLFHMYDIPYISFARE